jgi:hypothetical protein
MTRVASYRLLQCTSCGQKHILPSYGSINLTLIDPLSLPMPDDLRVCQRCAEKKPIKAFIQLTVIQKPERDSTPKWFRPIRRLLDKKYKEAGPHPMQLYPNLESKPFDSKTYFPDAINKYMKAQNAYPEWYVELSKPKN